MAADTKPMKFYEGKIEGTNGKIKYYTAEASGIREAYKLIASQCKTAEFCAGVYELSAREP